MIHLHLTAALELNAADKTQRRFEILAYSGGVLNVDGFDLPVIVDLSGLEASAGVPILIDHTKSVEYTLGTTDDVRNSGTDLKLSGIVTATSDLAKQVVNQNDAGQTWQASIGAHVTETELIAEGQAVEVNGQTFAGPVIVARRSTLRETSVLPMGADSTTSVNLAASAATSKNLKGMAAMSFEEWIASLGLNADELSDDNRTALMLAYEAQSGETASEEEDAEASEAAAATATAQAGARTNLQAAAAGLVTASVSDLRRQFAAETRRIADINLKAAGHPSIAATAIEKGWSLEKVELEVLKASAARTRPTSFTGAQNAPENQPQVLEAAVCMTRGHKDLEKKYTDQILQAAHSQFRRGIGLQQLFLMAAADAGMMVGPGVRINAGNIREVLAYSCPTDLKASFSTVSLPGILSNVANLEILEGYMEEDTVWREIAGIKTVSDFKTVTSYRLLDDMEYEQLGPTGRIKHGTLGEESYTRQADTYAKMFTLTRRDIINDDMSALDDLRARIGRGSARKLNNVFWSVFINNSAFYTAARKNYIDGATTNLGTDGVGLGKGVEAFRKRTSPTADGAKRLGGRPSRLLVPPELETIADQLYTARNFDAVKASDVNTHVGKYQPIVANQLSDSTFTGNSATAWYLLGDKSMGTPVVVSFLNGQESPTVESADADFTTLGVQLRGYHDFGVDEAEYLSAVKSKGAA